MRQAGLSIFIGSLFVFRKYLKNIGSSFARRAFLLEENETAMQWIDFVLNNASLLTGGTNAEIDKLKELKKLLRYSDSRPYSTQSGRQISTLLNSRDPSLIPWFRKREIHYESDLTALSHVSWQTSYKREMSVSQIATMRSVSNISSKFNHCDTYSSGFASGPLGIFANLIVTKLNYFFEDELKHKEIWKIEDAKPYNKVSIMGPAGTWHPLCGELEDCLCVKRIFHSAIGKFEEYVKYLKENCEAPLVVLKSLSDFHGAEKLKRKVFQRFVVFTTALKTCKPVDAKLHTNTPTAASISNPAHAPVRQHIVQSVEQRLRRIFSFALQDQRSNADATGVKRPPLNPHEISAHFYKNSINGQIGLNDFLLSLRELGISIQPNECHELMKLIAAPVKHAKGMEVKIHIDAFLKFFFGS